MRRGFDTTTPASDYLRRASTAFLSRDHRGEARTDALDIPDPEAILRVLQGCACVAGDTTLCRGRRRRRRGRLLGSPMVEWSRRRRGMYDITRTRMLLTTAVFAAVAALSASGANARIPADTSSAGAVQESLRTGRYAAQPPSWRGKGGKGEETGGATNRSSRQASLGAARRTRSPSVPSACAILTSCCRHALASPRERPALQRPSSPPATAAYPRRRAPSGQEEGAARRPSSPSEVRLVEASLRASEATNRHRTRSRRCSRRTSRQQ